MPNTKPTKCIPKSAPFFPQKIRGVGGLRAVWKFSENSSVLVCRGFRLRDLVQAKYINTMWTSSTRPSVCQLALPRILLLMLLQLEIFIWKLVPEKFIHSGGKGFPLLCKFFFKETTTSSESMHYNSMIFKANWILLYHNRYIATCPNQVGWIVKDLSESERLLPHTVRWGDL